jgi:hypothetical protein
MKKSHFIVDVTSLGNRSIVGNFSPCSSGFVVEEEAYNFSFSLDLANFQNREIVRVVLDGSWE